MLPFKSTSFFDEKYYTENQAGRQIVYIKFLLYCSCYQHKYLYSSAYCYAKA